ncbi:MAG TPA: alpha/beta fold hydrolase [Actinocrinis sp.]|nr:alpha/beta fold hydrolase [Actinocrinis sp.]
MSTRAASSAEFYAAYDAMLGRWPVPVKPLDVPTSFGPTRANVCGPGDAPALVLLHGGRTSSPSWFANVARLSENRRVYALDTMGDPGRSVNDGRPIRGRDDLMAWLEEAFQALGLERADLCGHSFGAWMSLEYSLRAPHRVRRLALLDPTQCFAGLKISCLLRAAVSLVPGRSQAAYYAWESGGEPLDPDWLALQELAKRVPTAKLVAGEKADPRRLRGLKIPVLVLLAGKSRVHDVAKVAAAVRETLPDATVATLPGVSHHMIPFARPERLDHRLTEFLG